MSDRELRRLEQALAVQPDAAELHQQRAGLLRRVGRPDQALAALELAWRLGGPVWAELQAELDARRVERHGLTFCYVPAGPFVMGRDDFDGDAPPRLVELSAFYVASQPLAWEALRQWEHRPPWVQDDNQWFWPRALAEPYDRVQSALAHLNAQQPDAPPLTLPTEAQWERVFRASYLTADRTNPYGVGAVPSFEWTRDHYRADAYETGAPRDPTGPDQGELRVVRGITAVPEPFFASFREAAREDAMFPIRGRVLRDRWLERYPERGLHVRPVFPA